MAKRSSLVLRHDSALHTWILVIWSNENTTIEVHRGQNKTNQSRSTCLICLLPGSQVNMHYTRSFPTSIFATMTRIPRKAGSTHTTNICEIMSASHLCELKPMCAPSLLRISKIKKRHARVGARTPARRDHVEMISQT
jgi:hypothetical protein